MKRCWHCDKPIRRVDGNWAHRNGKANKHEAEPDPAIAMEAAFEALMDDEGIPEEDRASYGC